MGGVYVDTSPSAAWADKGAAPPHSQHFDGCGRILRMS
jgi:hypothetical protein